MSLYLCLIHKDFGVLYRVSKSVDMRERESEIFEFNSIVNKIIEVVLQNFIEQKLESDKTSVG